MLTAREERREGILNHSESGSVSVAQCRMEAKLEREKSKIASPRKRRTRIEHGRIFTRQKTESKQKDQKQCDFARFDADAQFIAIRPPCLAASSSLET